MRKTDAHSSWLFVRTMYEQLLLAWCAYERMDSTAVLYFVFQSRCDCVAVSSVCLFCGFLSRCQRVAVSSAKIIMHLVLMRSR
mmetsp:Transcript_23633/g.58671  ORF Transcript_23633/g.58671 Transcript_23633/m.58671 type:complete len:83 (-) Transcript_23633:185-433(-)